jgi:hypothetical protein
MLPEVGGIHLNSDAPDRHFFERVSGTGPKGGRGEGVDDWYDIARSRFQRLSSKYGKDAIFELMNLEQNVNAVIVQWQRIEQVLTSFQGASDSPLIGREDVRSPPKGSVREDRLKVDLQFLLLSLSRLEKHFSRLVTIINDATIRVAVRPIAELLQKSERAERFLRQLDDFGGLAEAQVRVTETGRVQFHYNYGDPRADGDDVITIGKSDVSLMTGVYGEIISYLR